MDACLDGCKGGVIWGAKVSSELAILTTTNLLICIPLQAKQ